MPQYDSADLLQRFMDGCGRPAADDSLPPAKVYRFLTDGQQYWTEQIAVQVPRAMLSAPVLLTSDDGGYTYPIRPNADAAAVEPMALRVRASRDGSLLHPGPDWDDATGYILEGSAIRWPNHEPRTFADGPYAQWVSPPGVIDAGNQPTLQPVRARILIVDRALIEWARSGGYNDPSPYRDREQEHWEGNPELATDVGLLGSLKQQYESGYGTRSGRAAWWHSPDLGR